MHLIPAIAEYQEKKSNFNSVCQFFLREKEVNEICQHGSYK